MILPDQIRDDDLREQLNDWELSGLQLGEAPANALPANELERSDLLYKHKFFHVFGQSGRLFARYDEVEGGWVKKLDEVP